MADVAIPRYAGEKNTTAKNVYTSKGLHGTGLRIKNTREITQKSERKNKLTNLEKVLQIGKLRFGEMPHKLQRLLKPRRYT